MKFKISVLAAAIIFIIILLSCTTNSGLTVKKTGALFKKPECVVFDEQNQCLYISNINGSPSKKDGNGFISKTSTEGEIIEQEWIDGLDAPKGMFIKDEILYCTDINNLVLIDITIGEIVKKTEIPGSLFLNDLVVTNDKTIIITDSKKDSVFKVDDQKISMSNVKLKGANGIYYDGENIYLGANGDINIYNQETDSIEVFQAGVGNVDGIIVTKSCVLFTNYFNRFSEIENNKTVDIDKGIPFIDCRTDFCQLTDGTVVIPDFDSRLFFYEKVLR